MKRNYIAPQTDDTLLLVEGMMATSVEISDSETMNSESDYLSNEEKSFWGDTEW